MAAHGNGTPSGPRLQVVYCVICLILITNVSFIKEIYLYLPNTKTTLETVYPRSKKYPET